MCRGARPVENHRVQVVTGSRSTVRGRPAQVWSLALVCLVSSLSFLLGAVAPMSEHSPVRLAGAFAVGSVGVAALVWWVQRPAVLHLAVTLSVLKLSLVVAVAATDVGQVSTAIGYVWICVYCSFFLSRHQTHLYLAAVVLAFGAALAVNPFPGAVQVWFLIGSTAVAASEAVARMVEQLTRQAVTDPLTGLLNRAGLRQAGEQLLSVEESLTAAVIDLDDFKAVNDDHGHAAGDQLLIAMTRAWKPLVRSGDVGARHGGDEFVLLLPRTEPAEAELLLRRLQAASPGHWSYGLAEAEQADTLSALLARADRDLYRAKAARVPRPRVSAS